MGFSREGDIINRWYERIGYAINDVHIVNFFENASLVDGIRYKNVNFYMLGDSVLRDTTIALQNIFANGKIRAKSRHEGKADCLKNDPGRRFLCYFDFGNENFAEFVWFQWFSLPHRFHDVLKSDILKMQQSDVCSTFRDFGMKECMAHVFVNATKNDVAIFRVGLNYLLFEKHLQGYDFPNDDYLTYYEQDISIFLSKLADYFPGQVLLLGLSQVLREGQVTGMCNGSGFWDKIMWELNPKIVLLNDVLHFHAQKYSIAIIDPHLFIDDDAVSHYYGDCVHPSMPGPIPFAVANLILNYVFNK